VKPSIGAVRCKMEVRCAIGAVRCKMEVRCAIGAVRSKMERMLLQTLRCRCAECAVHHERNVREEQHHIYVARTSNNRVISSGELCRCLLPQCEALRTCRSGFPITTLLTSATVCIFALLILVTHHTMNLSTITQALAYGGGRPLCMATPSDPKNKKL